MSIYQSDEELQKSIDKQRRAVIDLWNAILSFQAILAAVSVGLIASADKNFSIKFFSGVTTIMLVFSSWLVIKILRNFVNLYEKMAKLTFGVLKENKNLKVKEMKDNLAFANRLHEENKDLEEKIFLIVPTAIILIILNVLLLVFKIDFFRSCGWLGIK